MFLSTIKEMEGSLLKKQKKQTLFFSFCSSPFSFLQCLYFIFFIFTCHIYRLDYIFFSVTLRRAAIPSIRITADSTKVNFREILDRKRKEKKTQQIIWSYWNGFFVTDSKLYELPSCHCAASSIAKRKLFCEKLKVFSIS